MEEWRTIITTITTILPFPTNQRNISSLRRSGLSWQQVLQFTLLSRIFQSGVGMFLLIVHVELAPWNSGACAGRCNDCPISMLVLSQVWFCASGVSSRLFKPYSVVTASTAQHQLGHLATGAYFCSVKVVWGSVVVVNPPCGCAERCATPSTIMVVCQRAEKTRGFKKKGRSCEHPGAGSKEGAFRGGASKADRLLCEAVTTEQAGDKRCQVWSVDFTCALYFLL